MRERAGLVFSSAAHVALLAYAFIGLGSAKPFEVGPTEALPIEILSPQEFDAMTKGSKTSKKVDAPKVKAEKVAAADPDPTDDDLPIKKEDVKAPPPPQAEAAPPPPQPEPKPEPKPEPETAKAEAEKAAKAEAEKAAKAEAAKAEAEKVAKEKAEKLAQTEAAEAELRAKEKAEKAAKEKAEQQAKAEAEKAAKEKAEAEKAAKLAAEKAAKEKAEKLAKAEAEKAAKQKALAEKKAAERKFDLASIEKMIDAKTSKSDTALKDVRDPGRKERAAREAAPETTAGTSRGTATKLSMSERAGIDNAVRDQVSQCWSPPVGGVAGENMIVRVKFTLNEDGSLSGQPSVDQMGASRAAADAALRAVRRCSPLKLPAEAYDYWRSVDIRFDPKDMMGG